VGYAGGTKLHPTYRSMGDHTEMVQIDFDPSRLSYAELLREFWDGGRATHEPYGRQYMSAILFADDFQRETALTTRDEQRKRLGQRIYTEIAPLTTFTRAEDYHQKYYLREYRDVMLTFADYDERAFEDSTVAARLNAYVAGHGNARTLERDVRELGLAASLIERVLVLADSGVASCGF
jgi:peptide-methionine (S)-S-oxide reductase